ncbi:PEP-CTERM sorting domain-containing protein [Paucibacter sp. DJ2R-2]|uniref:PEP-CTERM sorting domain-containing protein n=1 Tax=Paucibacter sp. DJ2R-2 TaxID=2893558 RepID=UPI0021E514F1|nr:PEP-CTERM sorting domain-containing protein [Paucibacter sp. DJ2R-2]MCV2422695.1 PEP-CTERM sorting domain-containing protein [Paucibacter sp. DJ4R-1]MCV2441144.1 PEP-CTERM sorting domain-containing protein [Paucibacter sp. DJ2R-2]
MAVVVGVLAVLATPGGFAVADPITLHYSGVVTQASFDPYNPWQGAVSVGSAFGAGLHFDTSAVDAAASSSLGSYTLSGLTYSFAPKLGLSELHAMSTVNISIVDGVGGGPDQYTVFASEGVADGLEAYYTMAIVLDDASGTAFNSDALLAGLPDFTQFSVRTFALTGRYFDPQDRLIQYEIQGDLTVPEPGTALLGALALLGCTAATRRQKTIALRAAAA